MRYPTKALVLFAAMAIGIITLSGCDRRTPEERLATAFQFYQQGDAASAEMEALKVVEKAPEDPASIQASMLLAQIYGSQNRFEEAEMQLKSALKNVSQLDPAGKSVLRLYLASLTGQEKFDEALKTVDSYQKEYADDPGTSLSLIIAGADIRTMAGETTAARQILSGVIDRTTAPAELALYRDMYMRTYLRDSDTTSAIKYLQAQLSATERPEDKRTILLGLTSMYAAQEDYQKSRQYLEQLTATYMDAINAELDNRGKNSLALQLAQTYLTVGNLPGSRRVLQTMYDSGISDPQAVAVVVNSLTETLLRLGETSATESLLQDAAKKHPQGPFAEAVTRMREMIASGELQKVAPMDTSTLTMKYKNDQNILWPEGLPQALGEGDSQTTGTAGTAAVGTTGTSVATTATTAPSRPAQPVKPAPSETNYSAPAAAPPPTETIF